MPGRLTQLTRQTLTWLTWVFWRYPPTSASERLARLAAIAQIAAGILCLCLSGAVFTGWWQGTLQAFGVGFTVGGVVDVLAISRLNQVIRYEDQGEQDSRRENNLKSEDFLLDLKDPETPSETLVQGDQAERLLSASGGVDPQFRAQLEEIARRAMPYRLAPAPASWRTYGVPGGPRRSRPQQAPRVDLGNLGREDEPHEGLGCPGRRTGRPVRAGRLMHLSGLLDLSC
jgi:hypothetical protein